LEQALNKRDPRTLFADKSVPAWLASILDFKAIGTITILEAIGFAILLITHPALPSKALFSASGIVGGVVLFAGAFPGLLSNQRLRHLAQQEASFPADENRVSEIPETQRLLEKAETALASIRRNQGSLAVLLIDLNQFQKVNDGFGRKAGDQLLQALAQRLNSAIGDGDTVTRLEGDEFAVLQVGLAQPSGAASLAARLIESLSEPYQVGQQQVTCGASIGVAIAPNNGGEWETLLARADDARRRAKTKDDEHVCFFESGMDAAFRKRRALEGEIRRAFDTEAFQLAFQPQFTAGNVELMGFEALLRWPAGWKQKSPAMFIPVAEECGLMVPVGAWVLETACMRATAWAKPLKLSVNVSPGQFYHGGIVATVEQALRKSGLDPKRLELEVTESLWVANTRTVLDQLAQLRAMGVSITLDDFGAGTSSLRSLSKYSVDAVKIDRSFVKKMSADPQAHATVKTIVAMGKSLHLTITAKGVETRAQADALTAAGCDRVQGYLYGRPLSATSPIY
jgi:diguanylate cyclase (GGDEF)-like protein